MDAELDDFAAWYGHEHAALVRALLVIAGDADVGSDVVADAFTRAYERWPRVRSMDDPTGWVYRVAVNLLRRRWRRSQLERRLLIRRPPEGATTPEPAQAPELWDAIARLPRRQREAIALRYVADLSERQVADAMGIAEGTASATLAGARRRLAEDLPHLQEAQWT